MKVSQSGIDLIKKFEGCRLYAYRDSVGVLTIGYGHTKNVKAGMAITQRQADEFLRDDIVPIEKVLNTMGVRFSQWQFDSLVSWIFNLGVDNFNKSTMKKCIVLHRSDVEVTDQMVKWVNAGGKPLLGLKRRRVCEANTYLGKSVYYIDVLGNIKKKATWV